MLSQQDVVDALNKAIAGKIISADAFGTAGLPVVGSNILTDDDAFNDTADVNVGGGPANTSIVALGSVKNTYNLFASGQNVDNLSRNLSGNIPLNTIFILGMLDFDVTFVLPPTFGDAPYVVDAQALTLAGMILLQASKINIKINSRDRYNKTLSKWVSYRYPAYLTNGIAGQAALDAAALQGTTHEEFVALGKIFDNPLTFPSANALGASLTTDVPLYVQSVYGGNIPASVQAALAIPLGMHVDMDLAGVSVKPV